MRNTEPVIESANSDLVALMLTEFGQTVAMDLMDHFTSVLEDLHTQLPTCPELIDIASVQHVAWSVKCIAASYSVLELATEARGLEEHCKTGDLSALWAAILRFRDICRSTTSQFRLRLSLGHH